MSYFNLPSSTIVNRFIPKNAFDGMTNAKQKKKFVDLIDKITWLNKLSKETINLPSKQAIELQIIEIKLKEQVYPKDLLDIIDRAIPYNIIFVLGFQDQILLHTSIKHQHTINQDNAVIDWSFSSGWVLITQNLLSLALKISLDFVLANFCAQLCGYKNEETNLESIIEYDKYIISLKKRIANLESDIKNEKQFNKKVDLNLQLSDAKNLLLKYSQP